MQKIGKEKPPNCVSYLKLTNPDGTLIADKTHNMPSYKPGKSMEEPIPNLKGIFAFSELFQVFTFHIRPGYGKTSATRRGSSRPHSVVLYNVHSKQ